MIEEKVFVDIMNNTRNSPLMKLENSKLTQKEYINLSIGQPHFKTPQPILDAIMRSMKDGFTKYDSPFGIFPLREKIVEKYSKDFIEPISIDNVMIGSGVSNLINLLSMANIKPNDVVLLIEPYYFAYKNILSFYKAEIITIQENFTYDDLLKINKQVKMIIFTNPSNPTGYILTKNQIYDLGRYSDNVGAILVSDEIYHDFNYEADFISAGSIYPKALVLMGFSKSYSMTGFRLGMAIGPKSIIERMAVVQTNIMICTSVPIQWGGIAALELSIKPHVELYKSNMERFIGVLKGKSKFNRPKGGFYIFFDSGYEDTVFLERALQTANVLLTKGSIFTNSPNYIRLSFCVSEELAILGSNALKMLLHNCS